MRQGKENAVVLYEEIKRQADTKKDYIAPTNKLQIVVEQDEPDKRYPLFAVGNAMGEDGGYFDIKTTAHDHIAMHTGIHKKYYDRMLQDAPDLLATNVNHWFNKNPDARMVRTLDGAVRAMLSPKYRPFDNMDLSNVIFQEFANYNGDLIMASAEITERRLYMKFVLPGMQAAVRVGEIVSAGVEVRNSEIGYGRIAINPFIYTLACTNGMVAAKAGLKRNHVGNRLDDFEEAQRYFADETRAADDRAFFMKIRDVFRGTLNGTVFNEQVELLKEATTKEITGNVEGAVSVIANKFTFTDEERSSVLQNLIRVNDLTKYGIANAVTRTAEDLSSYDRASEFEKIGGEIIVLPQHEWRPIAEAFAPEEKKRRGRKPSREQVESVYN